LIKDYELQMYYQPGKANRVADGRSGKTHHVPNIVRRIPFEILKDLERLWFQLVSSCNELTPSIIRFIRKNQMSLG